MLTGFIICILGFILVGLVMIATWRWATITGNAGIVDVVWTFSLGALACFYAFTLTDAWIGRRVLVAAIVVLWSLRLGLHILQRYRTEKEDGRYAALKKAWGEKANSRLLYFYIVQAIAASFLSIAFIIAMTYPANAFTLFDGLGLTVAIISIGGEATADRQLRSFKNNLNNKGKLCRNGLWAYSRHPNYFFEWIFWFTFPVIAAGSSTACFALISPIFLFYFITQKTGIPPTEEQALRSRGESYRQYQQEVNAFFPWFPKRNLQTDSNS